MTQIGPGDLSITQAAPDLSFLGTPEWAAFIDRAEREANEAAGLGWYWKEYIAGMPPPPPPAGPEAPPAVTPPSTTPGLPDADDASAKAILMATLQGYGLGSLGTWAWNQYLAGAPVEQILLDMRETPEYQARFPAMKALASQGRAMSEAEYINYENGAKALFKAAGLPTGFYDGPDDFDQFLLNDIALPELEDRVNLARVAVYNSDSNTLQAIQDFYNVGGRPGSVVGDLTAWFLDEHRALPLIQNQFIAAQTSGVAARVGYGQLTRSEAERLAMLGIAPEAAQEGFGTLARMSELFGLLPGEEGLTAPTRAEGQSAMFEGNVNAQASIERAAGRRRSEYGMGANYEQSRRGIAGIG